MKRALIVLAAVLTACCSGPVNYNRVEADTSLLAEEQAFVADLLKSRIEERTPASAGRTLHVSFCIDSTLSGEQARISIRRGKAVIRGARLRAVIAGTGVLLRTIRYGEHSFSLQDGQLEFAPKKSFREVYFGRHYDTWYHRAPAEDLLRYTDDMALRGMNAIHSILSYPNVDAAHATAEDLAFFADNTRALAARVRRLDMDLTCSSGGNIAPKNMPERFRATLNTDWRRGGNDYNVCPEKPGAMDYLLTLRKEALEQLRDIPVTGLEYWPYDEGGCGCPECSPRGSKGYPKIIGQYRHLNEAAFPGCMHMVSTWCFDQADWEGFYPWLEQNPWVSCLIVDAHGDFPEYVLEHPVPNDTPVITFPEITMWGRYPWGSFGAIATPQRHERLFRQAEPVSGGCQLYSEGIFEDINKFVVNGLYINPSHHADDLLEEYAAFELPGTDPKDFVRLVHLMEETHETYVEGTENDYFVASYIQNGPEDELERRKTLSADMLALAEKMDGDILPSMRSCWRWRVIMLRAIIDKELYAHRQLHSETLDEAYRELIGIYHAQKQAEGVLKGYGGHTCPPLPQSYRAETGQSL